MRLTLFYVFVVHLFWLICLFLLLSGRCFHLYLVHSFHTTAVSACLSRRGGKGVIALKFKKSLDDSLACFRVVGPDDEIMLSTFQVHYIQTWYLL